MNKRERQRQIAEVTATLDGKPIPLRPLERVKHKILYFRRRSNSGVSLRLSPEETDELLYILSPNQLPPLTRRLTPTLQEYVAMIREANRYQVGERHQ